MGPEMEDPMIVTREVAVPLREIVVRTSRSSGPGGQHANVTDSRVEASLDVTTSSALSEAQRERVLARCGPVVRGVAQDARSQARNRELALERLRERLARALAVPRARRPTRPTAASKIRRREAKRRRSDRKRERRPPRHDD
jgi:ribosome-associated protein